MTENKQNRFWGKVSKKLKKEKLLMSHGVANGMSENFLGKNRNKKCCAILFKNILPMSENRQHSQKWHVFLRTQRSHAFRWQNVLSGNKPDSFPNTCHFWQKQQF